jgi:hypothetical protein
LTKGEVVACKALAVDMVPEGITKPPRFDKRVEHKTMSRNFISTLAAWVFLVALIPGSAWAAGQDAEPAPTEEAQTDTAQTDTAPPPVKLNLKDLGIPGLGGGPGFGGGTEPATLSASFRVQEGSRRGTLSVNCLIEPDWHVFSITQPKGGPMPSSIKVKDSEQFKLLGPFQADRQPHVKPPDVFPVNSEEHEEQVIWTAPLELAEGESRRCDN